MRARIRSFFCLWSRRDDHDGSRPRETINQPGSEFTMACEGNNVDMISTLPDHIICHILSFIPTKYSVRTSVLSSRWKYLFTQVPVLHFDSYEITGDMHRFIHVVNSVMHRYDVNSMQKFVLEGCPCGNHANRWVSDAIRRNVRELCIGWDDSIQLPVGIYTSKTLVRLEVDGSFISNLSDDSILPSLKTLKLFTVKSAHIRSSNFPVLEDLDINYIPFVKFNGDICVSSLKRLKVSGFGLRSDLNLVLNVPALEFMTISCNFLLNISGSMLESLVEAHLGASIAVDCEFRKLLKMVSNVHHLSFCHDLTVALACRDFELPIYQNLTCLKLSTQPIDRRLLLDLLESSPKLEMLILYSGKLIETAEVKAVHECVCLSLHLKEVQIISFQGAELEFQIVEYFLKNAKVLNLMSIYLRGGYFFENAKVLITQRLLALPRYSRDCEVVVY